MYKYTYHKKPEAILVSSKKVGLEEMTQKLSICSCLVNTPQKAGAHPKEGEGLSGCSFVDRMISNILGDLLFSWNQPLKTADD